MLRRPGNAEDTLGGHDEAAASLIGRWPPWITDHGAVSSTTASVTATSVITP